MAKVLEGKVAIVSGAGRGIGRAIALRMAAEGARVVVNDLGCAANGTGASAAPAAEVVSEIESRGGKAVANLDSIADPDGAERLIQTAIDNFGKLDILVNCAGILRGQTLWDMTAEEWDSVVKVNLYGYFYCTRAAVRWMRPAINEGRQKGGRVINFTSETGLHGHPGNVNYGAAKAGVIGFTKSCAWELRGLGITCNAVAPRAATRLSATTSDDRWRMLAIELGVAGADSMPIGELKRKLGDGSPEAVAPVVAWLASERASDVTGRVFMAYEGAVGVFRDVTENRVEYEGGLEGLDRVLPSLLADTR